MKKWVIKKTKKFIRFAGKNHKRYWIPAMAIILLVFYLNMTPKNELYRPDARAYQPLLKTIANGESKGNYNAYFGKAGNTDIKFTEMSVRDVMSWQKEFVKNGSPSSAVGKYQIIRPTMQSLVNKLDINPDEKFDEALQDRMAIALVEKRGSIEFANDKLTREQFAANLAKEWAALPKVVGENPNDSFYAGDGINKAHVSVEELFESFSELES